RYLPTDSSLPSSSTEETFTSRDLITRQSNEMMNSAPQWFRDHLSALPASIVEHTKKLPAIFQYFSDPDPWAVTAAVGTYWHNRLNSAPEQDRYNLIHAVMFAYGHLYASLLGKQKGALSSDRLRLAASACAPELTPLLLFGYEQIV